MTSSDIRTFSRRVTGDMLAVAAMLVAAGSVPAAAQRAEGPRPPATVLSPADQEVVQTSTKWFDALMRGDLPALERLQTEDFLTIQQFPEGVAVVDKPTQMSNLRKAGGQRVKYERQLAAIKVRRYGNVAILTGLATFRSQIPGGTPVVSQTVESEVWVNENGAWRMAHFQPTDVPTKPPK